MGAVEGTRIARLRSRSPLAGLDVTMWPTMYLLGTLSALKAVAIVGLATSVSTGIVQVVGGHAIGASVLAMGIGSAVLRAFVAWAHRSVATRALLGTKERLRAALAERALEHGDGRSGSLATLATHGLDELDKYFTVFLPALVTAAAVPALLVARILIADWVSALIIVLTVPLIPLFMVLIGIRTQERVAEATTALGRLSDHLIELARGLPVLVGLGRAREQVAALRTISDSHRQKTMQTLRTAFLSALALEMIATISVAIVAVFIGVRLVAGDLSLEVGLLVLILAPECMTPFREIGVAFHASQDGREAIARTRAILDAPRRPSAVETAAARGVDQGADPVRVENLSIRYPDRSADTLRSLSFTAPRGEITVLEGRSGTGKSTVFRVLAGRLIAGDDVTVSGLVGGVDSGRLAWLPQHPHTTAETVLDELLLYAPEGAEAEDLARGVLSRLGLAHLASAEPSLVSPGELRRVAFGRVLLRIAAGANVVLLDEPTSQLDAVSARAVIAEIVAMGPGIAVIVASHDPAVRAIGDRRVLLSGGVRTEAVAKLAQGELAVRAVRARGGAAGPTHPLRELAGFLRPVAGRIVGTVVLGTLAALFALSLTGLSGWLIVRASEHPPIMYLLVAIVGVRFFGIGRSVLRYSERLVGHSAVFAALTDLRMRLWSALASRGARSRDLLTSGSTLDRLVRDVDQVRDLSIRVVLPAAVGLATLVVTIAALGIIAPVALPLLVAFGLVGGLAAPLVAFWADARASR
ncbi:MAG: ATP-binding cassette, subfamily bacterial CydCD, partial [Microbacteriaceae bacterium]|nr:ATP-binding cassette, subfamily bacterial CydCD [Microbacteriaceae bacterium]